MTADQGLRGGRVIELKQTVDKAVSKCPSVKRVFVMQRTGAKVPMGATDFLLEKVECPREPAETYVYCLKQGLLLKEMEKQKSVCEPANMASEDALFMLYTSGSTGKPKGLLHTQAGYLLYTLLTHKVSQECYSNHVVKCNSFRKTWFLSWCLIIGRVMFSGVWRTLVGLLDIPT